MGQTDSLDDTHKIQIGALNTMFDPNAHSTAPTTRELFPTGPSLVEVKWVEKQLSTTGKEKLAFRLIAVAGSHTGQQIIEDCYLTDAASWRLATFAKSCGVNEEFDVNDPSGLLTTFVGKQMKITVNADEYKNRDGQMVVGRKISSYESLDPDVAKEQQAERNARISAATRPAPKADGGEEIPF